MSQKQRVGEQPGFVLHTHPWRETSLIVEAFSRDHGRIALVAKGARRPLSALRGVIMAFQPLLLDWSGGGEVKTLVRAERGGGQPLLTGRALMCGYYLNELLVRLTPREDPHPALFDAYARAIAILARNEPQEPVLRRFELALLRELGYGIGLDTDSDSGEPVEPGEGYVYIIERGPVRMPDATGDLPSVSGQTLLDLEHEDFSRAETLVQSKALLRMLINHYLGGQTLQSRRVLKELLEL
ncbi:DNA repair protein RecO [Azoarcus sp. DN11]|uniref:DNA repair protein RecO n=1 Tax=Azoarcus sp. DN11 TaxID=356837 RepID=UPI000EABA52D|nr:DNA repair protein RecO [Azoarcus sp. DN11]AYH44715.1 DNA repair protein RecO [Azoarcus sp. DN11]